jgi:hypothetical protein
MQNLTQRSWPTYANANANAVDINFLDDIRAIGCNRAVGARAPAHYWSDASKKPESVEYWRCWLDSESGAACASANCATCSSRQRNLGETGPLSQGVQAGRKAFRIRHISGTEDLVRKKTPRGFQRSP